MTIAPPTADPRPLILTLALAPPDLANFEQQRRRYFPAALNHIPAHISLFHALPGEELTPIHTLLTALTAATGPFSVSVDDVQKLGRGVAYALRSDELDHLHARLRTAWLPWLTPQDRQGFRPHVVIQNKVQPSEAQALYARLSAQFRPYFIFATGLLLWRYLGGPWALESSFAFAEQTPA